MKKNMRYPVLWLILPILAGCDALGITGDECEVPEEYRHLQDRTVFMHHFFDPPPQPDLSGNAAATFSAMDSGYDEVKAAYDSLLSRYPDYIQRSFLGLSTGSHPMYTYSFTPDEYSKTLLITSGLHGTEKLPVWALLFFLQYLAEEGKEHEALADLRNNVRLIVVPVANPYGFNAYTRQNGNGVDLNRNFNYRWNAYTSTYNAPFGHDYKGPSPHSEPETRIIANLLERYSDATAYLDLHSLGTSTHHWMWYRPGCQLYNETVYEQVVERFGKAGEVVTARSSNGPTAYNYAGANYGMYSSLPEFSRGLFGEQAFDSGDMTAAVRWFGNLIIGHALL